ncbi:gp16 family phage-associated protein [Pseudomonas sp. W3I7]|nr:gp16 family phage-associated protein [Pseudomonas sp. W3I7]
MTRAADNRVPAALDSVFVGMIRVAYQRFGQSAQLLFVARAQLTIQPNQTSLNVRKLIPRRCRNFNVNNIRVCAIQHAYHSIKSIAVAMIWGQAASKTRAEGLAHSFGSIVSHGLNKPPNRSLIIRRDTAVLLNNSVLNLIQRIKGQGATPSSEDVGHIEFELDRHLTQVGRRSIARSRLVVRLCALCNPKCFRDLVLCHAASLPFFLQPRTDIFRKMHFFSSLLFTSAPKCIIVHLTPHEIARICTMPNTSVTEQARYQAREALEKRGQSAKDFAAQHQLNPSTVYAVLSGQSQCRRGEAHRAAVLLGIKDGVIEQ